MLAFISFATSLQGSNLYAEDILSAAHKAMIFRSGIGQAYVVCILPLLSAFCYSDSYYIERETGLSNIVRTRISHATYLLQKMAVIFFASSMVAMLPFIINQGLCLLAYPYTSNANIFNLTPYDGYMNIEIQNAHFPILHMNAPYLNNLVHIVMVGLYGGNLAILSFCISFYIKKHRILVLTSTTIVILISYFVLAMLSMRKYIAYFYLFAEPTVGGLNVVSFLIVNLVITLTSFVMFCFYINRDSL